MHCHSREGERGSERERQAFQALPSVLQHVVVESRVCAGVSLSAACAFAPHKRDKFSSIRFPSVNISRSTATIDVASRGDGRAHCFYRLYNPIRNVRTLRARSKSLATGHTGPPSHVAQEHLRGGRVVRAGRGKSRQGTCMAFLYSMRHSPALPCGKYVYTLRYVTQAPSSQKLSNE